MPNTKENRTSWRVFVSSTYEDMIPYREAASSALTSIEHLPIGMEHFVSSPEKSLDVCLTDVRRCQLYVVIVGMRYGSIDKETGKSYTELEYEEALRNKIPILAFVINENECAILPKYVDTGENAEKLKQFKQRLNEAHMVSRFSSTDNLKELLIRAVENQLTATKTETKKQEKKFDHNNEPLYVIGAKLYKKFLLLPERYKNVETTLRIRMDGGFSTWRRREEYFTAFGVTPGDTIIGNDIVPLGVSMEDIDSNDISLDFYAEGKNADWILEHEIKPGTIFEGKFRFSYEIVKGTKLRDVKIAALIMLEGISIIGQESRKGSENEKKNSIDEELEDILVNL